MGGIRGIRVFADFRISGISRRRMFSRFSRFRGFRGGAFSGGFRGFPRELSAALCGAKNQEQLLSLFKALDNLPGKDFLSKVLELAKGQQ